jgi:hypothetical protein
VARHGRSDCAGLQSAFVTIHAPVEYFSCPICHLALDGYDLIGHVGLPDTFDVIDDDPNGPSPTTATTNGLVACDGFGM